MASPGRQPWVVAAAILEPCRGDTSLPMRRRSTSYALPQPHPTGVSCVANARRLPCVAPVGLRMWQLQPQGSASLCPGLVCLAPGGAQDWMPRGGREVREPSPHKEDRALVDRATTRLAWSHAGSRWLDEPAMGRAGREERHRLARKIARSSIARLPVRHAPTRVVAGSTSLRQNAAPDYTVPQASAYSRKRRR